MNVISMLCLLRFFFVWQAFLTLRHETKIEHVFLVGNTGKKFEIKFVSISYFLLPISLSRFNDIFLSTCSIDYIV